MQIMPATGKELKVGDIHADRAQHPRRREVHGPAHDPLLPRREVQRDQPVAVRLRDLQRGPGQHRQDAQGGRASAASIRTSGSTTSRSSRPRRSACETTTYVRNIYKYYVAYKLMLDHEERKEGARDG